MPSLRPRWPPPPRWSARADDTPAPTIVGSWAGGTLHLWGWDGAHTALPNALHRAFEQPRWGSATSPFAVGHLASIDIAVPGGEDIRPASVRVPA